MDWTRTKHWEIQLEVLEKWIWKFLVEISDKKWVVNKPLKQNQQENKIYHCGLCDCNWIQSRCKSDRRAGVIKRKKIKCLLLGENLDAGNVIVPYTDESFTQKGPNSQLFHLVMRSRRQVGGVLSSCTCYLCPAHEVRTTARTNYNDHRNTGTVNRLDLDW